MLSGERIRAARELLGWSRAELGLKTRLPLAVIEVVEEHGSTFMLLAEHVSAIRRAFDDAGLEFVDSRFRKKEES